MPEDGPPIATVTLSVYEWHELLKALEQCMRLYGRHNPEPSRRLYERISSQLLGRAVIVERPERIAPDDVAPDRPARRQGWTWWWNTAAEQGKG